MAAVAAVFSAVASFVEGRRQAKQAKKANRLREQALEADKEEAAVRNAEAKNRLARERFLAAQERRKKIARIRQAGENFNVGDSSAAAGAASAVSSNFGAVIGRSAATSKAIEGINAARDRSASLNAAANNALNQGPSTFALVAGAIGGLAGAADQAGIFNDVFTVPKQNKTPNGDEGIFGL